jgi:hypothetical protein
MLYILIAVGIFASLVWLGREAKAGRLKAGPWIKDFRVVRSVMSMILGTVGITFLMRGQFIFGAIACVLGVLLSQSARLTRTSQHNAWVYTDADIQAFMALGLAVGANKAEIIKAHRNLMKRAHPDAGGTVSRAKTLNSARDLLLKRYR